MSNAEAIKANLRLFVETKVNNDVVNILERVADRIILFMEKDVIPVDTGNLQDSTGIGIYHGDVLRRFIPSQTASEARANGENEPLYNPDLPDTNVWGTRRLMDAINYGAMKFSNGYCLVVFSSMQYAGTQNSQKGYFDKITAQLKPLIVSIIINYK